MYRKKTLLVSSLLGVALGSGHMTSLRFVGPIGVSEILFFLVIAALFLKRPRSLIRFHGSKFGALIKIYLLFSFLIVLPLVTLVNYFFSMYSDSTSPQYLASFAAGIVISYLIVDALEFELLDMRVVVFCFLFVFVSANVVALFWGYGYSSSRYSGFAQNPNQLLFYLTSLSLLLGIYSRILLFLFLPFLVYVGFISGSDAFLLSLAIGSFVFLFVFVFYLRRASFGVNLVVWGCVALSILFFVFGSYSHAIVALWNSADEGGARIGLMFNALKASLYSPVFGWGAGSFSGVFRPFQAQEAHNNILDLSMQFGFGVPLVIYGVIFAAAVQAIRRRQYLVFSLIIGFVISGIFHFSARHFVFWVEFGVFFYYVFCSGKEYTATVKSGVTGK